VVEIYFDDCFDLLNNKAQVAISGFGKGAKAKPGGYLMGGNKLNYDENGKWVAPFQADKNGVLQSVIKKEVFETKGQLYKELNSR